MPVVVYADYNCMQRSCDDQRQARIRHETETCHQVFADAEIGVVDLVWSFMHDDENRACPFPDRRLEVLQIAAICRIQIGPAEYIRKMAIDFQRKSALSAKDAVHLACAMASQAEWFLTCDDDLIRKGRRLKLDIKIANPTEYISKR